MPYPNNYNLLNPQQQYMNYFTPQMQQQVQQQISMVQQSYLSGKIIDSIETVRVTDIPMDGNPHYFPKADGSEIYVKRWLPNGSTEVSTFTKVIDAPIEEEKKFDFNSMETNLNERLNSIEEHLSKLEKQMTSKSNSRSSSKED